MKYAVLPCLKELTGFLDAHAPSRGFAGAGSYPGRASRFSICCRINVSKHHHRVPAGGEGRRSRPGSGVCQRVPKGVVGWGRFLPGRRCPGVVNLRARSVWHASMWALQFCIPETCALRPSGIYLPLSTGAYLSRGIRLAGCLFMFICGVCTGFPDVGGVARPTCGVWR